MKAQRRKAGICFLLLILLLPAFLHAADPEEAQYNVVVTLYNAGQLDAALKKVAEREALQIPDAMRARYLQVKGLIHERASKPDAAREVYEKLVKDYPAAPECSGARVALLYIDYNAGRNEAVVERYPTVKQDGLKPEEKKNLALIYAEALAAGKDDAKTLAAYQQALQLGADAAAVNPRLFDLYLRAGKHQELLNVSAKGLAGMDETLLALVRAEAALALKQYAPAEAEAKKVPTGHAQAPRAAYTLAQALIGQGKAVEAVEPLTLALQKMKDLPSPAASWFTLANCLSTSGKTAEAQPALAKARELAAKLPEKDRADLLTQVSLLELNIASKSDKPDAFLKVFENARNAVPAEKLPDLLFQRLHALLKSNDTKALLATMADDYPVLQKSPHDGQATLIYYRALRDAKRTDEARKCLEEFMARSPASPEAVRANVELSNARMQAGEFAEAAVLAQKAAAAPNAKTVLGPEMYHEVQYNRGLLALKLKDAAQAVQLLTALLQDKPVDAVRENALKTLGLAHSELKQYRQAADTWLQLLNVESLAKDLAFRDQLIRALFLANDYKAALTHLEAAVGIAGDAAKLAPETLDIWARSLFELQQFEESAKRYQVLYDAAGRKPADAYACAVAWDRAGKPAEAAPWYEKAARQRDKLPEEAAAKIDALLAQAQLASGTGDLGAAQWLRKLVSTEDDKAFSAAIAALLKTAEAGKLTAKHAAALRELLAQYPVESPRRYSVGALLVRHLAGGKDTEETLKLSQSLLDEFAQVEGKLPAQDFGATVAPAMIRFYRGELLRDAGQPADALVEYETVLSVYPYNEWPDAAACGVAECFYALGDPDTAKKRFEEVTKSNGKSPASQAWKTIAGKRLEEISKGE